MQAQARIYNAYGLRIKSWLPLPFCGAAPELRPDVELVPSSSTRNASVAPSCAGETPANATAPFYSCDVRPDGSTHLRWAEHFDFLISPDGARIGFHASRALSRDSLRAYLLGQALSFSLLAKRVEPIHGTAIVVGEAAVAFLGDSGFGKSSLAAAFLQRGCRLLTDDLLVLTHVEGKFCAHPGMPRLKLLPDTAATLFPGRKSTLMNHVTHKRIYRLRRHEHQAAVTPLRAIYLLPRPDVRSERIRIHRVSDRKAFMALLQNTFNANVANPERLEKQFQFASEIVRWVPVKAISRPWGLQDVIRVSEAILSDVAER